jgi:hypothetical protein
MSWVTWHVDGADLVEYATGETRQVMLASIEAHLLACAECREALAVQVDGGRRQAEQAGAVDDRTWAAIADQIDRGRLPLARSSRLLRVSVSSPPMAVMTSLLALALIAVVSFARIGQPRFATTMLVILGPLVPLVGARVAFSARIDPAGAMAAAAPLSAGRVSVTRAFVAAWIASLAGLAVSPLTTIGLSESIVWLLPALAVSAATVAIATFVDPTIPSVVLGAAWIVAVLAWLEGVPRGLKGISTEGLVSHRPLVQIALFVITVCALAVCALRRDSVPEWRLTS